MNDIEISSGIIPKVGMKRTVETRERTISLAKEIPTVMPDSKILNDPIHGHIEIPYLCIRIMDTPQFQRLRNLKQLGTTYLVFPGASHNRFEHCVGVCHLAGELAKSLQLRQPELKITDIDVLCVQIAGLCHDLGHGPFSHLFEHSFVHVVDPQSTWRHEKASIDMFDHMIVVNNLMPVFEANGLDARDIIFIKEMIYGKLRTDGSQSPESHSQSSQCSLTSYDVPWNLEGRKEDKRFLYEIVANKRNGIDVDKFDYFSRDCYHLNIKNNFDHMRWIKFARVINVDGQLQLCTRDKEVSNLYDLFSTRHSLHRRAYQHKVVKLIDHMVGEALVAANDALVIEGPNGKKYRLSEAINDMEVYCQVTDSIFERILWSYDPAMQKAKNIAMDIVTRKLYKCIGQLTVEPDTLTDSDLPSCAAELAQATNRLRPAEVVAFDPADFVIQPIVLDYGKKAKNPIDYVRFYSKTQANAGRKVKKDHVSRMLPENFSERSIRVFMKRRDAIAVNLARRAFQMWASERNLSEPISSGDTLGVDLNESIGEIETGDDEDQFNLISLIQ